MEEEDKRLRREFSEKYGDLDIESNDAVDAFRKEDSDIEAKHILDSLKKIKPNQACTGALIELAEGEVKRAESEKEKYEHRVDAAKCLIDASRVVVSTKPSEIVEGSFVILMPMKKTGFYRVHQSGEKKREDPHYECDLRRLLNDGAEKGFAYVARIKSILPPEVEGGGKRNIEVEDIQ